MNYMEELYDPGEYKLTCMFVVTFPALHIYFIYIKYAYFATFMKNILEPLQILFCENLLINKVNKVRLVKETYM